MSQKPCYKYVLIFKEIQKQKHVNINRCSMYINTVKICTQGCAKNKYI